MKNRLLLGAVVLVACSAAAAAGLVGATGVASADPTFAPLCGADEGTAGTALSGNYNNLTVHGIAYVASGATLDVSGDLRLAPGACLDAFSLGTVHVGHNLTVNPRATLALGCAPGSNGPPPIPPCGFISTDDTVGGSILAFKPQTMYLTAATVGGSVISLGGGFAAPGLSFPVKNMNIGGNLELLGWDGGPGAWIGALRNHVHGDMVVSYNRGFRPGDEGIPNDSTEIDGNTVGGNLVCLGNTPQAQYGDAYNPSIGNGPNSVGGRAVGECWDLTVPPPSS
jgi:hypothetical protein